jgi:peptidase E
MSSRSAARPILALGGGGFTAQEHSGALERFVLSLTGKAVPRICFLPTASGDQRDQAMRFHERFGAWPCEPSILWLFHLARDRIDPVEHLLSQDAIYVGGGSMRNLLAVWREHGVDKAMRAAWDSGVVLAGLSAGAMCWFEGGVSESGGAPDPVEGLGLLAGSLSVHMDSEPERLPVYRTAVASGELPPGYAADDNAALLYDGTELIECVSARAGARVIAVTPDDSAGVSERELPVRLLPGADALAVSSDETDAVAELRALRLGRHRWD